MDIKKLSGFMAVAGLLLIAAPTEHAQASSLINPGIAAAVQDSAASNTTEVRWHRGWHRHFRWHHRRHWRRW